MITGMSNLLFVTALLLITAWGIAFIGYSEGGMVHILAVFALTAVIFGIAFRKATK